MFQRIRDRIEPNSLWFRMATGVVQGSFGILLMQFGIQISPASLIDLRIVPVMIAAQVGGLPASLTSAVILILFRLGVYHYSSAGLFNTMIIGVCGILFGVVVKMRMSRFWQWWVMTGIFILLIGLTVWLVVPGRENAAIILVQYVFSVVAAVYVTQLLVSHLWRSYDALHRLRKLSTEDFLTGLRNVRSFNHEIYKHYELAQSEGIEMSLLLIDIDYFKQINDTYGHPAGDEVLREIGDVFMAASRDGDVVCRSGGEEFSVICPACGLGEATEVAESIRSSVEHHSFYVNDGTSIHITVSIGVSALLGAQETSVSALIRRADQGLYAAKRSGRNCICQQIQMPEHDG